MNIQPHESINVQRLRFGSGALSIKAGLSSVRPPAAGRGRSRGKEGATRLIVLGTVTVVTIAALLLGGSWLYYRTQHTVIRNASVKGRLYQLGARIDGQVQSITVEPGQRVTKGQVLVRLTDDHFQAARNQAQSELEAAQKKMAAERLAIDHERQRLALEVERCENLSEALAGEVEAAITLRNKWERETERVKLLIPAQVTSASEIDRVTTERDNARALLKSAEGNFGAAQSNCRVAQVDVEGLRVREAKLQVLVADVELARQRLAAADADLAAAILRAPEDGWVVERIVQPGGSAKVGEPMLSLWVGAPWIEAWVNEKKLDRVKIGNPVDVTLAAFPGRKLRGKVESIGILADTERQNASVPATLHSLFPNDAMIPIRISVDAEELRLQPGLTALVGIRNAAGELTAKNASHQSNFLASIDQPRPAPPK